MKLQLIEKGAIDSYKIIENEFNISLPKDYKEFLAKNNGAIVHDGYFFVEDLGEFILMDTLYGVKTKSRSQDIIFKNREYIDDIPSESILIGRDLGGGWLLLIHDKENDGIWYYDHSYFSNNPQTNLTHTLSAKLLLSLCKCLRIQYCPRMNEFFEYRLLNRDLWHRIW